MRKPKIGIQAVCALLVGGGGKDEPAVLASLAKGDVAPQEVAEGVADDPVGDAQAAGVGLDLLADGAAVEEEAVEVFVSFAEEDLSRLEIESALDTRAGLVEVAADRGVGGAPLVEEFEVRPRVRGGSAGGHDSEDASRDEWTYRVSSCMPSYIALLRKDPDSDYGVEFPDFPGCVTAGKDLEEARSLAEEALAFHLEGLAEDEAPLPEPSGLEQVMADPANRQAIALLVEVPETRAATVRVDLALPESTIREIDAKAQARGISRSAFLEEAALEALRKSA